MKLPPYEKELVQCLKIQLRNAGLESLPDTYVTSKVVVSGLPQDSSHVLDMAVAEFHKGKLEQCFRYVVNCGTLSASIRAHLETQCVENKKRTNGRFPYLTKGLDDGLATESMMTLLEDAVDCFMIKLQDYSRELLMNFSVGLIMFDMQFLDGKFLAASSPWRYDVKNRFFDVGAYEKAAQMLVMPDLDECSEDFAARLSTIPAAGVRWSLFHLIDNVYDIPGPPAPAVPGTASWLCHATSSIVEQWRLMLEKA